MRELDPRRAGAREAATRIEARALLGAGPILAFAPHPDDESIGCGGAIALARAAGVRVGVVLVTDGAASHPGSRAWPPERLAERRALEFSEALAALGVPDDDALSLALPDTAAPREGEPGFAGAVASCARFCARRPPRLIVAPWRRDPHCDHRATFELARAVRDRLDARIPIWEYPVWLWEIGAPGDLPTPDDDVELVGLDVTAVVDTKRRALRAHRTQWGTLIEDDPEGFRLEASMVERLTGAREFYFRPATRASETIDEEGS